MYNIVVLICLRYFFNWSEQFCKREFLFNGFNIFVFFSSQKRVYNVFILVVHIFYVCAH